MVNSEVHRSGRMLSRGEDFRPEPFFMRYRSHDCTTFRPDTSNSKTSGATPENSPRPTYRVRASASCRNDSG